MAARGPTKLRWSATNQPTNHLPACQADDLRALSWCRRVHLLSRNAVASSAACGCRTKAGSARRWRHCQQCATRCVRESDGLSRASSIAWDADHMGRTSRPQGATTGYATDYSVAAGRLARAATATEVAGKGCHRLLYCYFSSPVVSGKNLGTGLLATEPPVVYNPVAWCRVVSNARAQYRPIPKTQSS